MRQIIVRGTAALFISFIILQTNFYLEKTYRIGLLNKFGKFVYQNKSISNRKLCAYCVDHTAFNALVYPQFKASSGNKYFMILLIISSYRDDADARWQTIRQTWANHSLYLPFKIQHIFVLGMLVILHSQ